MVQETKILRAPGKLITLLIGETKIAITGVKAPEAPGEEGRSAPTYVGIVPAQKLVRSVKRDVGGKEYSFSVYAYVPDIIIVKAEAEFENIFEPGVIDVKDSLVEASRKILQEHNTYKNFAEEYGIFLVSGYAGDPEVFLVNAPLIAAFLKSEKNPLDEKEIQQTLEANLKYAKDDLVIVDWDGAFVFDPGGKFEDTVKLLEIGNLQLLKYRIFDYELDKRMEKMLRLIRRPQRKLLFRSRETREIVRETIRIRSQLILEFETTERNIKLIGDWYSARLYDLIAKKFHLEEWRRNIKEKFETLEDVYVMASENFTVSSTVFWEILLMFGWALLQIGWFILLFFDIYYRE